MIVRGIERRKIFRDEEDRTAFLTRLSELLVEADTDCFAWALLPNHFHLVLRPNRERLATVMRRLQTGHAVRFNRRHQRSGHLFRNRYQSIVCEEEEYLLELVRYVHLNPVRARLVLDQESLDRYPWSGHTVLLGRKELPGQAVDEVLGRFGRPVNKARKAYREFVAAGVGQGRRDDLVGGGLRRSLKRIGATRERVDYDERVLGGSEFVNQLRQAVSLAAVVDRVGAHYGLTAADVRRKSRAPSIVEARGLVCYVAVRKLGGCPRIENLLRKRSERAKRCVSSR